MEFTDRHRACLKLLAKLDQEIAECESLWREILADDEREAVAVNLRFRMRSRENLERVIARLDAT